MRVRKVPLVHARSVSLHALKAKINRNLFLKFGFICSKLSKCTSYVYMVSFSYIRCTVVLCFRPLLFDIRDIQDFYKCISELCSIIKNLFVQQSCVKNCSYFKYSLQDRLTCKMIDKLSLTEMCCVINKIWHLASSNVRKINAYLSFKFSIFSSYSDTVSFCPVLIFWIRS